MNIDRLFFNGSEECIEFLFKMIKMLYDRIDSLDDKTHPILSGEKVRYNEIIKENNIEEQSKEIQEVFNELATYFQRAVKWEHYGSMINITPPANLVSVVAAFYSLLYNPNFAQDESTGYMLATELSVVKMISSLVNWNSNNSSGIFTFGGKGTNLYAIKMAINKISINCKSDGVKNENIFVISSEKAHPCHKEVCDWLGIGIKAHISIPVCEDGRIDMQMLERIVYKNLKEGKKLACIMLNGGTTNENLVDPIKEVCQFRDRIVKEFGLRYEPHIHVDAVIGWAWLFFSKYNFELNRLHMSDIEKRKIKNMLSRIQEIKYADSFGADFHKTGFCPYISSLLMVKDKNRLHNLGKKVDRDFNNMKFGEYSPFEYSLELSRSSIGPIAAYTALRLFGYEGFQELICRVFSEGEYIRGFLNKEKEFYVLNNDTEGFATLFIAIPDILTEQTMDNFVLMKYSDIIQEYNYRLYLFLLESLEYRKANFKITFSKSFKLFGMKRSIGALKIYQTSPVANIKMVNKCLKRLKRLKRAFDINKPLMEDDINRPIDFVYRG